LGDPIPICGVWLTSLGHSLAHVKNLRGQHPVRAKTVSQKSRFGWVQTNMSYFVDSGPKFTILISPNAEGIVLCHISHIFLILDMLTCSGYICDQSRKLCEITPNFACFWPQIFFGVGTPNFLNFWTWIIKRIQMSIANFHGNRPRELGDPVVKEINKKNKKKHL